jgi:hypothetical protein
MQFNPKIHEVVVVRKNGQESYTVKTKDEVRQQKLPVAKGKFSISWTGKVWSVTPISLPD